MVAALTALFGWVAVAYRGLLVWPTFAGGFIATALGVLLALYLEGERSRHREREDRRSEARLAFSTLSTELTTLRASLVWLSLQYEAHDFLQSDLPTGSWEAMRTRLGFAISDFELVAELARLYDRVSDVRGWIKLKADAAVTGRTSELPRLNEQLGETLDSALALLDDLQSRVRSQIDQPTVDVL